MRAARNPARYGPRQPSGGTVERGYPFNYDEDPDPANYANRTHGGAGGAGGPRDGGQTRTQGLARAIVDSFPLVKFVRGDKGRKDERERERTARREEVEDGPKRVDGSEQWSMEVRSTVERPSKETRREEDYPSAAAQGGEGVETFSPLAVRPASPSPSPTLESTPPVDLPRAGDPPLSNLGADVSASSSSLPTELDLEETDEHCPICLLDFEDGCVTYASFPTLNSTDRLAVAFVETT